MSRGSKPSLYFGTLDNGDVVGQQIGQSTIRDISQAISNDIKPAIHPIVNRKRSDDGKNYIQVDFHGSEPPYACKGIYRTRVADEDIIMADDELRQIVLYEEAKTDPRGGSRSAV